MSTLTTWLRDPNPASRMQSRLGQSYLSWLRLRRNTLAMIGLGITFALILMAVFAPYLAPHDPITQELARRLLPPLTPGNLLGTDDFGRDCLLYTSRCV